MFSKECLSCLVDVNDDPKFVLQFCVECQKKRYKFKQEIKKKIKKHVKTTDTKVDS